MSLDRHPNTRPIVWVVQEQHRLDYSDAERFGEVKFMTHFEYSPRAGSLRNNTLLQDIRSAAMAFDHDRDYLLLTGSPITIGYAMYQVLMRGAACGRVGVKILRWERERNEYVPLVFNEP